MMLRRIVWCAEKSFGIKLHSCPMTQGDGHWNFNNFSDRYMTHSPWHVTRSTSKRYTNTACLNENWTESWSHRHFCLIITKQMHFPVFVSMIYYTLLLLCSYTVFLCSYICMFVLLVGRWWIWHYMDRALWYIVCA